MKQIFDRLNEIAAAIEPLEAAYKNAWKYDTSLAMEKAITEAAAAINAALEPYVDEIAQVTNNSAGTIRMAFGPKDPLHVWFGVDGPPSEFLRNVAKHSSFSPNFWAENERRADEKAHKDAFAATPGAETAPVVSPAVAAAEIAAGRVPRIDEKFLPQLKAELLLLGVLELYNAPRDRDSYSPTRPFAYVANTASEFRFWPKNVAMNQVRVTRLDKLFASPTSGAEPAETKRPRNRP